MERPQQSGNSLVAKSDSPANRSALALALAASEGSNCPKLAN